MYKRILFVLASLFFTTNLNAKEQAIDILQLVAHPALDRTALGVIDQLKKEGYNNIKLANAHGDLLIANQIAKKFIGEDPACIVAIPTGAAQAFINSSTKTNIPIVFSSVTDPVSAGLVKDLMEPEKNITGVSNFIDVKKQIEFFKQILPNLRKLGVIYNPGEVNSAKIVDILKNLQSEYDIEIITSVASKTVEVSSATAKLLGKVDAIFISNDNNALAAFKVVTKLANNQKTPVFVSDTDLVMDGALASLGPNQYDIGIQTGKMIAQILKGKSIAQIPVEYPNKVEKVINIKVAEKLGITISPDLLSQVEKK